MAATPGCGAVRMRQHPGRAVPLDVADGAVALLLQLALAPLKPADQFIEAVLACLMFAASSGLVSPFSCWSIRSASLRFWR